jgi:drug/metabolite transporter (DMT)-like permease
MIKSGRPPSFRGRRFRDIFLAVLGLPGVVFLQYYGFSYAPIVEANIISYSWPLMTVGAFVVSYAFVKAIPPLFFSLVGFLGVVLMMTGKGGAAEFEVGHLVGYGFAVGSAVAMAAYTAAAGRFNAELEGALVPAAMAGVALALYLTLSDPPWPPVGAWWPALYLGIGPMAGGYLLWTKAMAFNKDGVLAVLGYATPLFSTAALVGAGHELSPSSLVGGGMVFVSCGAIMLFRSRIAPFTAA